MFRKKSQIPTQHKLSYLFQEHVHPLQAAVFLWPATATLGIQALFANRKKVSIICFLNFLSLDFLILFWETWNSFGIPPTDLLRVSHFPEFFFSIGAFWLLTLKIMSKILFKHYFSDFPDLFREKTLICHTLYEFW